MCGLAGTVFAVPSATRTRERCLRRLRHRGPDGTHEWSDAHAWLGHTRLRILDTSGAADQPMVSADGGAVLVYNGEVYNYRALRDELGQDWLPRSASDTDVVLEMLVRHGASALPRFNGMWALALWRPREQRLLLARDRFGVKPLYYAALPEGGCGFASELGALAALMGEPPTPAPSVLARFLLYGEAEPSEGTFFKGLSKLPPGSFADVTPDGVRVGSFWNLREAAAAEDVPPDVVGEYGRRFRDAVLLRLRSDVPVGTCLSGGVDSSSIVCAVRRASSEGLVEPSFSYKAFSARHPGTTSDEGAFIETVLSRTHFEGHSVVPRPDEFLEDVEALVRHQGEPFGSLGVYSQWCVMRLASQNGVTVLLDGQGADEVLAGYPLYGHYRLGDLARRGHWRQAWRLARAIANVQGGSALAGLRSAAAGLAPVALRRSVRDAARTTAARFTARDLAGCAGGPRELPRTQDDRFTQALYASITSEGLPSLLRYEDRNSMAFSIEARVPFLDWRLVTLGLRLPAEWKLHEGWTKWVLREAMAEDLPETVRWRRDKKAFASPQAEWLRGPLQPWVWDFLKSRELRERGWVDVNALQAGYRTWLGGGPSVSTELWWVLSAELWARQLPAMARAE